MLGEGDVLLQVVLEAVGPAGLDARSAGEVDDGVDATEERRKVEVGQVGDDDVEHPGGGELGQLGHGAATAGIGHAVDDDHTVAVVEQAGAQGRADEPGAARDEYGGHR